MSKCSSGCPYGDCPSYGYCLKRKNVGVTSLESTNPSFSRNVQKEWDSELDRYEAAVKQGIQPMSTRTADINLAVEASNEMGVAFDASAPISSEEAAG